MQIISVTSEALQATIRRLLPSQAGFSEDLEAVNTIQPIIDLTPTAEGSVLPTDLQQALDITSNFTFCSNQSKDVTSTPGFYTIRMNGAHVGATGDASFLLEIVEGATVTTVAQTKVEDNMIVALPTFTVFLNTSQTLRLTSNSAAGIVFLTARQVATLNGELVNPNGFQPQ